MDSALTNSPTRTTKPSLLSTLSAGSSLTANVTRPSTVTNRPLQRSWRYIGAVCMDSSDIAKIKLEAKEIVANGIKKGWIK